MAAKLDRKMGKEFEINCTREKRTYGSKIGQKNSKRIWNELHRWNKEQIAAKLKRKMGKEFEMNCTKEPLEMKLKGSKAEGCKGTRRLWERDWKQIAMQTDCKKQKKCRQIVKNKKKCKQIEKKCRLLRYVRL